MTSLVAQTILAQLGGSRFVAMTGARNIVAGPDMLQFDVRGQRRITKVRITLGPDDLYALAFYHWNARQLVMEPIATRHGVSFDQLQPIFTAETGLATRL